VASDLVPRLDGEGYDGHEAECEPLPARAHTPGHVAAVLAGYDDVFVAFEGVCKGMRSAGEEEEHGGDDWGSLKGAFGDAGV